MPTPIYEATPMLQFRAVNLAPGLKEALTLPRENRQIHASWGFPGEINRPCRAGAILLTGLPDGLTSFARLRR